MIKNRSFRNFIKKILKHLNFEYTLKLNGENYKIPVNAGNRATIVEYWMLEVLKLLLKGKENTTFVDIGVNLGQTLLKVKSIDPNINFIGFEPNPACVYYLEELIRINKIHNCKIYPFGLYTETGVFEMSLYDDYITNSGGSIVDNYWEFNNIKPKRKLLVPIINPKELDFSIEGEIFKIDVEGAEYSVIFSLKEIIKKNKPIIICEVLSAYDKANSIRYEAQDKLVNLLNELEYLIFVIQIDNYQKLVGIKGIKHFEENMKEKDNCNYLFIPKSKLSSLEFIS